MATGPWHYREAEQLLQEAGRQSDYGKGPRYPAERRAELRELAQVHATLALAAATAMCDGDAGYDESDWNQWRKVAHKPGIEATP